MFTFGGDRRRATPATSDMPILFYSRRIGLRTGARGADLGRRPRSPAASAATALGVLNIQTRRRAGAGAADDQLLGRAREARHPAPQQHRRDRHRPLGWRQSRRGLATRRTASTARSPSSTTSTINTYCAQTADRRAAAATTSSYRAQLDYAGDRYGLQLERLWRSATNFNPEVGFVRRDDMRKNYALARFSPRPQRSSRVRKFSCDRPVHLHRERRRPPRARASATASSRSSSRTATASASACNDDYELLPRALPIVPGARMPPAATTSPPAAIGYVIGQQRTVSGSRARRAGHVLQRRPDGASRFNRARVNVSRAAVARAERLAQLDRACRPVASPPSWPARASPTR